MHWVRELTARAARLPGRATMVGTAEEMRKAFPDVPVPADLGADGYWIYGNDRDDGDNIGWSSLGAMQWGAVDGTFAFLRFRQPPRISALTNIS